MDLQSDFFIKENGVLKKNLFWNVAQNALTLEKNYSDLNLSIALL